MQPRKSVAPESGNFSPDLNLGKDKKFKNLNEKQFMSPDAAA